MPYHRMSMGPMEKAMGLMVGKGSKELGDYNMTFMNIPPKVSRKNHARKCMLMRSLEVLTYMIHMRPLGTIAHIQTSIPMINP